jgi:hypothetical protein
VVGAAYYPFDLVLNLLNRSSADITISEETARRLVLLLSGGWINSIIWAPTVGKWPESSSALGDQCDLFVFIYLSTL